MTKALVLWGGTDIGSSWYNEKPHPKAQKPDVKRDEQEFALVHSCIFDGVPIIGICRGAQLLCIANGGTLYQHSVGHNRGHTVFCKEDDVLLPLKDVAAGHHQVMNLDKIPQDEYEIFGFSNFPCIVWVNAMETKEITISPEVVWFPKTKCLAIQPHPEWMPLNHPFNLWLQKLIFNLLGEHYAVPEFHRL